MLGRKRVGEKTSLVPRVPEHVEFIYDWWLEYPDFYPGREFPTIDQYTERYEKRAGDNDWTLWSVVVDRQGEDGDPSLDEEDGPEIVGITELGDFDAHSCFESFLFIVPEARGRGYGSEAVQLRTAYAYEDLDVELLETTTEVRNVAVQRVLEQAGYRRTGQRPHAFRENGQWQDVYFYVIVREWWETHRASQ